MSASTIDQVDTLSDDIVLGQMKRSEEYRLVTDDLALPTRIPLTDLHAITMAKLALARAEGRAQALVESAQQRLGEVVQTIWQTNGLGPNDTVQGDGRIERATVPSQGDAS